MTAPQAPHADRVVDATGEFCPVPVIEIARAVKDALCGEVVELRATDPGVESDLPAWCKATRNHWLGLVREGRVFRAFVRKA